MVWEICLILVCHWIADFLCQSDTMAKNKSSKTEWLVYHCTAYTLVLTICSFTMVWHSTNALIVWGVLNGLIHCGIDAITSRISSNLWARNRVHDFFVVVGMDQLLHTTTLIITFKYMVVG